MLNVSECSRLNLLAILPGIRETKKLVHLSVHDLSVADAVTDKESVLATFKDVFDCLSLLKFLDVGWIKDAGAVTGWDIACAILECRGSGLTHLDVSGLASLRETLRFVKDLGIERSFQYLGALHTNLRYGREGNDDNRPSPFLRNDLVADVDDLKVVATGFQNVDAFVLCQSHYLTPTPRNNAILKLIADCLIAKDYYATEEEKGVLLSFFLRKCRAARRSKWESSSPLRSILQLAKLAAYLCEKDPDPAYYDREFNRVFYSICHELILIASSFSSVSSAVKLTEIIGSNYVNLDHADVDLEQRQLLLVIAFCHLKSISPSLEDLEALSFLFPSMLFDVSDNSTSDVVINQGLASALIDLLESSLASSKSRPKAEAIVKIFESHLLDNADISIYVAQQIDRCSDDLCSLYNTLDGSNARHAKTLLEVFYLLSVQKSKRSLLEKPAVFSLIWKSMNFSDSDNNIQCVAAEFVR